MIRKFSRKYFQIKFFDDPNVFLKRLTANKLATVNCNTTRKLHLEVPDEEYEAVIKEKILSWNSNFDSVFSNLKLPYKMRRMPDLSKEFLKYRIEQFPNGFSALSMDMYQELYENLDEPIIGSTKTNIGLILDYYNRIMRKSLFSPSTIPVDDMKKMLTGYDTLNARLRYVHFLFIREFDVWRNQKDSDLKRKIKDDNTESFDEVGCFDTNGDLQYGYWRNTMFGRYHLKSLQLYSLHKLRQAQLFGQKIVIDCSYNEMMADYETISVARQISSIYHENRYSVDPFHLLFCGYQPHYRGYRYVSKMLANIINKPEYFLNLYQTDYRQMMPDEKIIYLSPDSRKLMTEFDPNAVYVIGALVSKTYKAALSFEKAQQQGVECLRLPIHQYVELKPGVKRVLSFQGVFKILLELKQHGDWYRAFRAGIAPHKLLDSGHTDLEDNSQSMSQLKS